MQASARQAFKILTSKIHPQLPLSPRESELLLGLLTTSFRKHLDQAHPAKPSARPRSPRTQRTAKRHPASDSSFTSVDRHIETILTNPLFAVKASQSSLNKSQAHRPNDTSLSLSDPLRWFEQQVALGSASIGKALICLENIKLLAELRETGGNVKNIVQHDSAGHKVLSWLRSNGATATAEFICDLRFVTVMADSLAAEGHHDILVNWLKWDAADLKTKVAVDDRAINRWKATILKSVIRRDIAELPDVAMSRFVATLSSLDGETNLRNIFQPAGMLIVDYLICSAKSSPFATATYDKFLSQVMKWSFHADFIQGLLGLHHPTQPTAREALSYLQRSSSSGILPKQKTRSLHIQCCLDTAHLLIIQERHNDAQWVLEFAQQSFPEELGNTAQQHQRRKSEEIRKQERQREQNEAKNLESLEALSLA